MWMCIFFFFKQKTAYEMRISDWSSDVCSSDLLALDPAISVAPLLACRMTPTEKRSSRSPIALQLQPADLIAVHLIWPIGNAQYPRVGIGERSEERRVGKECVST